MIHARPDYNHIQDPKGKIPDDEPVLLFRAQDKYAARVLEYYASVVELNNGDPEIVKVVRDHAELMRAWPKKKSPDM